MIEESATPCTKKNHGGGGCGLLVSRSARGGNRGERASDARARAKRADRGERGSSRAARGGIEDDRGRANARERSDPAGARDEGPARVRRGIFCSHGRFPGPNRGGGGSVEPWGPPDATRVGIVRGVAKTHLRRATAVKVRRRVRTRRATDLLAPTPNPSDTAGGKRRNTRLAQTGSAGSAGCQTRVSGVLWAISLLKVFKDGAASFPLARAHAPLSERSANTPSYITGEGAPSNMGSASSLLACALAFALEALHASNASLFLHTVSVE